MVSITKQSNCVWHVLVDSQNTRIPREKLKLKLKGIGDL